MKKNSHIFLAAALLAIASAPLANAAPSVADLAVSLTAPSIENVNVANLYTVRVQNIGRKDASGVRLTLNLPLTNTSPQRFVMGEVSQLDSRCSIQLGTITCLLNTVLKTRFIDIAFRYSIPVSRAAISISALASTASSEPNQSNNSLQYVPNLRYVQYAIVGQIIANNSHCTGTNLNAYFECLKFPSSIAQHQAVFEADGTITFPDAPAYYGFWQQNSNQTDQLAFQYWENGSKIAEFNGKGSVANCFDGITEFLPASNYVSPYRVCF